MSIEGKKPGDPMIESESTLRAMLKGQEDALEKLKEDRVKNAGLIEVTEERLKKIKAKLDIPEENI